MHYFTSEMKNQRPVNESNVKFYSQKEEQLNIWSHAVGIVASVIGLILLLLNASSLAATISAMVYGSSMILLYSASTFYHSATNPTKRAKLRILDHASIYLLIAGTYTPFAVITLADGVGNWILLVIWLLGIAGVSLKLFFTGKFTKVSTILYVAMGWIGVFAAKPMMEALAHDGLMLVLAGGISYTIGAVLYAIKSLKYNHAIFHFFVLLGSLLHFLCIYWYVI